MAIAALENLAPMVVTTTAKFSLDKFSPENHIPRMNPLFL